MASITLDDALEEFREVTVIERIDEAPAVVSFRFADPTGADLPEWEPGAHIDVELGGDMIRQYSLCSRLDEPTWRIEVLKEEAGRGGSKYVHENLQVGDTVRVRGPRNHFPFITAKKYLFIAGGIGVTPLMPMLRRASDNGADWSFYYGGRSLQSMAFVEKMADYGVIPWPQDEKGLLPLTQLIEEAGPDTAIYCCGPEPLLSALENACKEAFRPAPHVERFAAKVIDTDGDGGDHEFTVVVNSSGNEYQVPVGTSIAEVLLKNNERIVTSCAEGVCGTCETKVLEGEIVHRDSLLSDEDKEEGIYMMPCVSRCKGDRLVLDI
jgi:ferredoxin-NADP reductase